MLTVSVSGSYCTGEAGKSATASSSVAALLEAQPVRSRSEEGEDSAPQKSLADQHKDDMGSGKKNGAGELPKLARRAEDGEDVELDKARLKRAMDEERKRKKMGEDEAWQQTKKSKTDVTQEELGKYSNHHAAYDMLTWSRGVSVIEANLRRSDGELHGSRRVAHHLYHLKNCHLSYYASSRTSEEAQGTHSIRHKLAQPLTLLPLLLSQCGKLTSQLGIGDEDVGMDGQEDAHERLNSFEVAMRS